MHVTPLEDTIEALLQKGIALKEKQELDEAEQIFTEAFNLAKDMYPHGALHALINIGSVWKLRSRLTRDSHAALQTAAYMQQALDYLEHTTVLDDERHLTYFHVAQSFDELGLYEKASALYEQVYSYYKEHPQGVAFLGDIERHFGLSLVRLGKRNEGISHIESGLQKIRTFDMGTTPDRRNYVWETGALLALALVYKDTKKVATRYAKEALDIATRESLVIRKHEAEMMLHYLSS